jgi:hypothetical protein
VRTAYGRLTTFDVGQVYTGELQINTVGEIAGAYQDVSGEGRGFVRSANGSITKFNPGGSRRLRLLAGLGGRRARLTSVVGLNSDIWYVQQLGSKVGKGSAGITL